MLQTIDIKGIKSLALDSAYIKVHPDGTGAPKKTDSNLSAEVVGGLTTKIHPIIADENLPIVASFITGYCGRRS